MSTADVDRIPLLEVVDDVEHRSPGHCSIDALETEKEPSWLASYKFFLFGSWLNILLVFVPLSFLSHMLDWNVALRFSFSFLALVPLAALLGTATDQMSTKLGQTLSGLLNASFGNAVEMIIGVAALLQGQIRIVQTSMIGSVLSNLLLVFGCSLFAGGLKYSEVRFDPTVAQTSSSLMTLTCIALVIPAAYHQSRSNLAGSSNFTSTSSPFDPIETYIHGLESGPVPSDGLLFISRSAAVLLLLVYFCYLFFQLRTHVFLYDSDTTQEKKAQGPVELIHEDQEVQEMNVPAAVSALLLVTVVTSFCADYLVASIEETAKQYHVSEQFIGTILLPIVSNAADHVTAIWMARKDKMEITIGICIGSSIQILAFVVPFLVILGWVTHHELTLSFANFETVVLFIAVVFVQYLIQNGKSNYMEGVMLVSLYLMIATSCMLFTWVRLLPVLTRLNLSLGFVTPSPSLSKRVQLERIDFPPRQLQCMPMES